MVNLKENLKREVEQRKNNKELECQNRKCQYQISSY